MQNAIDKMDDSGTDIAKQIIIDALETRDADCNKRFIKGTLRSTWNRLWDSVLSKSLGIGEFFADAILQMNAAPKPLAIVSSVAASDTVAMAPTALYATKNLQQ